MNQFLAIVMDTWRQSVRQVVFIIMLIVLALLTFGFAFVIKPVEPEFKAGASSTEEVSDADLAARFGFSKEQLSELSEEELTQLRDRANVEKNEEEGYKSTSQVIEEAALTEPGVGWVFSDDRFDLWPQWNVGYLMNERVAKGERFTSEDMFKLSSSEDILKAESRIIKETGLSKYERSTQVICSFYTEFLFSMAMWFFIAAAAGYFPGLMTSGAIDVVLAKPLTRLRVFMAKYVGGMLLLSAALTVFHLLFIVVIGLRFDVWHVKSLYSLPIEIFTAGLLYALLAFLGILVRNSIVPILVGYLFYMVIDTVLGQFAMRQAMGSYEEGSVIDTVFKWARKILPNFTLMKSTASNATLSMPSLDTQPLWVGAAWLVISLGLGFWRFQRRDF